MIECKKIVCLINARAGSKGLPNKNILPLCDKPLIGYSIECALASEYIDRVVVSTDSQKIADIAASFGAEVPFLRPAELAADNSKQIDAMIHAVKFLEGNGQHYHYICLLQPTCPLRAVEDVDATLKLMHDSQADSAITLTDVGARHPRTLYKLGEDKRISPYLCSDKAGVLRQQFEELYWRSGTVYAMRRDILVKQRSLYGEHVVGHIVPENRCFNIDTKFDWDLCESYMRHFKS